MIKNVVRFCLCLALVSFIFSGAIAEAAGDIESKASPPRSQQMGGEGKIELYTAYPAIKDVSGETFIFEVDLLYEGNETRTFELSATPIPHWIISIQSIYREVELTEIRLEPGKEPPETIRVILQPLPGEYPEPGEYKTTVSAVSGDLEGSIELKAVVADLYRFAFFTESGRLNTEVTAGQENHIAATVMNTGTATIDKITIVGGKPEYWKLEFKPDEIENLEPGYAQEVDIIIVPTKETIPGDYMLNMRAVSDRYRAQFDLRVTVLTPTTWASVAVVIVLAVIAGVAVMFWRLGRR